MSKPSRITKWLLQRLIHKRLFDAVYGDLLENHARRTQQNSKWKADLLLLFDGLGYLRFPILMKSLENKRITSMIIWKNYVKVSLRSLTKNKGYTAVSIMGLVVSFTAFLAIMQYTQFERSYDGFHSNAENLYRVTNRMTTSSGITQNATAFYGAKDDFRNEIPEIINSTHILATQDLVLDVNNERILEETGLFATEEFFDLLSFPLVEGSSSGLLDPTTIFLSKKTAQKLFSNQSALNEVVEVSGIFGETWSATVAGVYEDIPANSHLRADIVLPMQKLISITETTQFFGPNLTLEQLRWRWLSFHTYVLLDDASSASIVEGKCNELIDQYRAEVNARLNQDHDVILQPVTEIHTTAGIEQELTPVNDKAIVNLFSIVAIFILIIGWINYINLNTAKSVSRGKEVGVRKVLGSANTQLKAQFHVEAFIINMVAFTFSIVLLILLIPLLENLASVDFFVSYLPSNNLIAFSLIIIIAGSFLSALYPAHVLAGFKSIEVLKGRFKNSGKGVLLRRVLVGVQFVFTLFLMTGLLVVHRQMTFMLDHDIGIDIDRTVVINTPQFANEADFSSQMNALKNEIMSIQGVQKVSVSSLVPGIQNGWRNSTEDARSERSGIFVHRALIDHDYFDLYNVELLAGRLFDRVFGSEQQNIILNRNTIEKLGYDSPDAAVGSNITFAGTTHKIVGVVEDYYHRGVQFSLEPFSYTLDTALVGGFLTVKIDSHNLSQSLEQMEANVSAAFPGEVLQSQIVEEVFQAQYENESRFRTLFTIFTTIAVAIAMLGLLGLASFILNQRMKEISIRKVLGAKPAGLFVILNKEYFIINAISFSITIPFAFMFINNWLQGFENRVHLGLPYFLVPLLITFALVLVATLGHTLRVLGANPAKILKEED